MATPEAASSTARTLPVTARMITRGDRGAQSYARAVTFGVAVARLACILAGVGLATTRIGLVLHELLGHGAVAMACGGTVLDVRLFWFAGGWIRYDLPEPRSLTTMLVISLGG